MWFVLLGVLLGLAKVADIDPVAAWSWWWVLSPFAAAAAWWIWSDSTGLTRKREIDKMEAKKDARRRKNMEALGISREQADKTNKARRAREQAIGRVEGRREETREKNRQTIRDSVIDSRPTGAGNEFGPKAKPGGEPPPAN